MKRIVVELAVTAFLITWVGGYDAADGQAIRILNGKVFGEGTITVGQEYVEAKSVAVGIDVLAMTEDLSVVPNNALACTPVHPLKKGDVLVADISDMEIWSRDKVPLPTGKGNVNDMHPTLGLIGRMDRDTDGKEGFVYYGLYPTVCRAKISIQAGVVAHSDGYAIQTSRPVKAGDSISAICIEGLVILSARARSETQPWFTALPDRFIKTGFLTFAIEVWKEEWEAR